MDLDLSGLSCPQYVCFSESFENEELENEYEKTLEPQNAECDTTTATNMLTARDNDISTSTFMTYESFHSEDTETTCNQENLDVSNITVASEYFPIRQGPKLDAQSDKRLILKPTIPKPFKFQTDSRVKDKRPNDPQCENKEFSSQLRKNILKPTDHHLTKIQPFKLHEGKKRKMEPQSNYKPLAEQVAAFQTKTPDRYHRDNKGFQQQQHWSPEPFVAKTPLLRAVKRRRITTAISSKEQEEIELQQMKEYEFHARPVNPKIYAPKAQINTFSSVVTESKSFSFSTQQRAARRHSRKISQKYHRFRARPVPRNVLNGPTGVHERTVIPGTIAKSPVFASNNRIMKRRQFEEKREQKIKEEEEAKKMKTEFSHSITTFKSKACEKKPTQIQAFSFDQADKVRFCKKEKKIQEELENEKKVPVFKAQLMPTDIPSSLPKVFKKPTTQAKPFNFVLGKRSLKSQNVSMANISAAFRAKPASVLEKDPFIPEKAPKPNIEIKEFSLHTNKRADEWQKLKEKKMVAEQEMQQVIEERKAEEKAQEVKELKQWRKDIVHKANPVPDFTPFQIEPSNVPLTVPETPKFETKKRMQARHE